MREILPEIHTSIDRHKIHNKQFVNVGTTKAFHTKIVNAVIQEVPALQKIKTTLSIGKKTQNRHFFPSN